MFIVLTTISSISQEWNFSTIDSLVNVSPNSGSYLLVDTNSIPNAFIRDNDNNTLLRYYLEGETWIKQDYEINFLPRSVVVDNQNNFHLCWAAINDLRYLYISGDTVTLDTVDFGQNQVFVGASVTVDSDNNPHIVYHEYLSGDIRYAYRNEYGWLFDVIDSQPPYFITWIKLLSYGNSFYAIAFGQNSSDKILFYRKENNDWINSVLFNGRLPGGINMKLNSSGYPGVYYSFTLNDVDYNAYTEFDGSSWDSEIIDSYYGITTYAPFDYDIADNPHFIQYLRILPQDPRLFIHTYRHLSGWQSDTILTGFYYPLALESESNIFHFIYESDPGLYYGRLDIVTDIEENTIHNKTDDFKLSGIYPNPFNSVSTIKFTLDKPQDVKLYVYDLLGRRIQTLIDEPRQAGSHTITFDASGLSSGVYFYRLKAGKEFQTRRMVLLK
jgi:hypothetical protein